MPAVGRLLRAGLLGSLFGVVLAVSDRLLAGHHFGPTAWAAYGLLGACTAAAAFAVLARTSNRTRWAGTALALATLTAAVLGVIVHVVVLPGGRMWEPRGLAGSAGILSFCALLARLAVSRPLRWLRESVWAARLGGALLVALALPLGGLWPQAGAQAGAQAGGTGRGPNVLLVVMDAVRRDHVDVYRGRGGVTPFIATLAPRARIYERAYAGSGRTRWSVALLLGSRRHGRPAVGLPERLGQAGYTSALFSDNPLLEQGASLSAAFHHVEGSVPGGLRFLQRAFDETTVGSFVLRWPLLARLWSDQRLVDKATEWLASTQEPFLLYVQLMNAHQPYDEGAIDQRGWRHRRLLTPSSVHRYTEEEAEDIRAHYAGGVRSVDAQVERLVASVVSRQRPSLIILTSDHGESLGEQGRWRHETLDEELVRVPLLVLGEGVTPGRVPAPVSHLSVLPTVLAAAGVGCDVCAGTDLRGSLGDARIEGEYPPRYRYWVRDGHKVVVDLKLRRGLIYDLALDPDGRRGRVVEGPAIMMDQAPTDHGHDEHGSSEEAPHRLRALGYLDP